MSDKDKVKSKGGRPTIFTDDVADLICEGIAEGKSMVSITKKNGMPKPRTVYRWIRENPVFRQNYENAKEDQADAFVEEMRDISLKADSDSVQVARLQIDVMKWTASKFKNKRYGDKLTTDNTNTTNLDNLSEEELDKKVKALINAAS
tara:strand:+ start:326 stop:769 length:444 start_codon:yes stop_codon:yes gene_type:complete